MPINQESSVGSRIVEYLKSEGVEVIFGQGELSLKDVQKHALANGIKMVGPHHESAGIWMAAAYYRLTGVAQVAMGAQGPGVANLVPGALWARAEFIPVIIIGACRQGIVVQGVRRGIFLHGHADSVFDAMRDACKFAHRVTHPRLVDEVMQAAFREALSGTPGPVYIEVDYAGQCETWCYPPLPEPCQYRLLRQCAAQQDIDQAVKMISSAQRPILLGGDEIFSTRTQHLFRNLCEALKCPVFTTFAASGALPQPHPQWLSYASAVGAAAISESDLVLVVGSCIPENVNYGRQRPFVPGNDQRRWIVLEQDASAVGVNRTVDLAIIGRLPDVLPQLIGALERNITNRSTTEIEAKRATFEKEREAAIASVPWGEPIHPNRLMLEAREAVPDDAVIVTDVGFTVVYQHDFFEKRSTEFIWGSFFAHMGTGLPQAIGAQLAVRDGRRVCLICGDGGLGTHLIELETAIRHRLPIVVICNDDRAFAAELQALQDYMNAVPETRFSDVRFDRIAIAMGGFGELVEKSSDIQGAIRRALEAKCPAVVQVRTDPDNGLKHHPLSAQELYSWVHEDAAQC